MTVDYYSLLTKAVVGKDAVARDQIYKEAVSLIARSHLTREAASSHVAALEDAVRRIEDDIAAETSEENAAEINEVLSTGRNWKPLVIGACAVFAVIALSAFLYVYVATNGYRHRRSQREDAIQSATRGRRRRHGGPEAWR